MSNLVSEILSIIYSVFMKSVFFAFPFLFVCSLLFKMNWIHHSSFITTIFILFFSTSSIYGIYTYLIIYIFIRGITGHYVPRCLPPFPYFMTGPQISQINYYKNDITSMPQIRDNYDMYKKDNHDGSINYIFRWFFPFNSWNDKNCLEGKVNSDIILDIPQEKWDKNCGSYMLVYDLYRPS